MRYIKATAISLLLLLSSRTSATAREIPTQLNDSTFWQMVEGFSEENQPYTDFYISNEAYYSAGAAQLAAGRNPGGVYVGVGAEQNFTYIAVTRPSMAFVVDIRRENMLEHLMYKALFEISPSRSAFVSRLFSRAEVPVSPGAKPEELFLHLGNLHDGIAAKTTEELRNQLTQIHRFPLSTSDMNTIDRIRTWVANHLVTYWQYMTATDEKGVQWSYLASEENYQAVRNLQIRNLIVPVTGDFAGTKALKSIAEYVSNANERTSVFYTSNVEPGLRGQMWQQFYTNIALLPFDSQGVILRAISNGGHLVPNVCSAQRLLQGFKNNTRKGFDPACED
jgi:hypothetical protein